MNRCTKKPPDLNWREGAEVESCVETKWAQKGTAQAWPIHQPMSESLVAETYRVALGFNIEGVQG
jgi:hypothetical protein